MAEESGFDKDEAIFLSIMYSFHAAAMQHMGKIANPFTGKVERDLDAARGTIDVLLMFKKKTEGNLSDREQRTLNNLITELQLNYVEEVKREPAAEAGEAAPKEEAAAAEGAGEAPPAEEPAAEEAVATPPPAGESKAEEAGPEAEAKEAEEKEANTAEGEKKPAEKKTAKKGSSKKKKKE